ncbi:MAG TPA: RidA family protein [Candidatus Dormibacteraeota bacterium]|nr:RidA family protein [Candidatus Dormibacteraeota bacterium]
MDRPVASPHEIRNPETLPRPSGFSHAVVAQAGRTVYLAGQAAQRADGSVVAGTMAEQFDVAAGNVLLALEAAGAHPQDLVSMQIFVTDIAEYQRASKQIGEAYRRHFGGHYPAMALLEVSRLFDPKALVELMCIAVTA